MLRLTTAVALMAALALSPPSPAIAQAQTRAIESDVHYRTARINGVEIAYREAGPPNAPVVLLLHGFPTSSRMFRNLIPKLADRYHVIAPDYPGFGRSAAPDAATFSYSFSAITRLVDGLMTRLGHDHYALYVQDYGAPVGYRLALLHPKAVTALVVQNGNAYDEGLSPFWNPIRAYWADPSPANRNALRAGLTPAATRSQYVDGVADPSRIDPENWAVDQALLDRPGSDAAMLDLFRDYRTNVLLYPAFHAFFRAHKPPTLIVWGKNDAIFPAAGARAYLRDLPEAELHLLDSGHFALEDKGDDIARLMRDFLDRTIGATGAAPTESGSEATKAIASVIETFRTAIIAKDGAALMKLPATDTISFLQSTDDDTIARARRRSPAATRMFASSYPAFVRDITSGSARMEEKFANIVIHADGIVGTVWFDYTFEEGGKVTNFGHETWGMVRTDQGWKIGSIVYSSTDAPESGKAQ